VCSSDLNPGENVYISKDHTLHARVDGVVQFQKKKDNKSYVSIVAFEA
jgi:large subunit ribosomal protein L27